MRCLEPGTTWYTACEETRSYSRPSGFSTIRATRPLSPAAHPAASLLCVPSSPPAPTALLCVATCCQMRMSLRSGACGHAHHSASTRSWESVCLRKGAKIPEGRFGKDINGEESILGLKYMGETAPFLELGWQDMKEGWWLCLFAVSRLSWGCCPFPDVEQRSPLALPQAERTELPPQACAGQPGTLLYCCCCLPGCQAVKIKIRDLDSRSSPSVTVPISSLKAGRARAPGEHDPN